MLVSGKLHIVWMASNIRYDDMTLGRMQIILLEMNTHYLSFRGDFDVTVTLNRLKKIL